MDKKPTDHFQHAQDLLNNIMKQKEFSPETHNNVNKFMKSLEMFKQKRINS